MFPSTSFEHRTAQALVGPRMNNLISLAYPGFEPGTFGAAAGEEDYVVFKLLEWQYEEI